MTGSQMQVLQVQMQTLVQTPVQTQVALLSAWGRGGSWSEHNTSSVFAPEEVFSLTILLNQL